MSHLTTEDPSPKRCYRTPPPVLDLVRRLGPIGLDPCSSDYAQKNVRAAQYFTRRENGLVQPWRGHGLVFANPPYGDDVPKWAEKGWLEFPPLAMPGISRRSFLRDELVLLVASRTDTRWFHRYAFTADALCFWGGDGAMGSRIRFLRAWGGAQWGAKFPSAVVYRGQRPHEFERVFRPYGTVIIPWPWTSTHTW